MMLYILRHATAEEAASSGDDGARKLTERSKEKMRGAAAGLRAMGLIRGGSLDNAIVLSDDAILNGPLRFPDEFGRHKALDLIGDLALVGRPLLGRVEAHKAGHALHTQIVSRLLADPSLWTETIDEANASESLESVSSEGREIPSELSQPAD